jgi:hypothetical protein
VGVCLIVLLSEVLLAKNQIRGVFLGDLYQWKSNWEDLFVLKLDQGCCMILSSIVSEWYYVGKLVLVNVGALLNIFSEDRGGFLVGLSDWKLSFLVRDLVWLAGWS